MRRFLRGDCVLALVLPALVLQDPIDHLIRKLSESPHLPPPPLGGRRPVLRSYVGT